MVDAIQYVYGIYSIYLIPSIGCHYSKALALNIRKTFPIASYGWVTWSYFIAYMRRVSALHVYVHGIFIIVIKLSTIACYFWLLSFTLSFDCISLLPSQYQSLWSWMNARENRKRHIYLIYNVLILCVFCCHFFLLVLVFSIDVRSSSMLSAFNSGYCKTFTHSVSIKHTYTLWQITLKTTKKKIRNEKEKENERITTKRRMFQRIYIN